MNKSIKIVVLGIISIFAFLFSDCFYGFVFGGNFSWITAVISFVSGTWVATIYVLLLFHKDKRKCKKAKETFIVVVLIFMVVCLYGYKPLNRILGSNNYTETQAEVVYIDAQRRSFLFIEPESIVTLSDSQGNDFVVEDYDIIFYYDEGDTVLLREYTGGFKLKYYDIIPLNEDN